MAACERCWNDAKMRGLTYAFVVEERNESGEVCTPKDQCGELHVLCVDNDTKCRCGLRVAPVDAKETR